MKYRTEEQSSTLHFVSRFDGGRNGLRPVPMSPRRFYNLRPMIGRRFGATGCRRYLTHATTSAQFTVDITPEGRKSEQQSDGSVKWDLPSNQIESGSAAMEVSTREFLDDYLSLAQRSSL